MSKLSEIAKALFTAIYHGVLLFAIWVALAFGCFLVGVPSAETGQAAVNIMGFAAFYAVFFGRD